jgi:hypothetical protein
LTVAALQELSRAGSDGRKMSAVQGQDILARTIVGFSRDGMFPEEDEVSAMHVQSSALPAALDALAAAKVDLEVSSISGVSSASYRREPKALVFEECTLY